MNHAMTQQMRAGWYPDPKMLDTIRYWDGENWTDSVAPVASVASRTSPVSASPSTHTYETVAVILCVLGLLGLLGGMVMAGTAPSCLDYAGGSGFWDCRQDADRQEMTGSVLAVAGIVSLIVAYLVWFLRPKRRR